MKIIYKVFNILITAVLLIAVVTLVFTAFSPVKSFRILRVMSGSMEPVIKTGSLAYSQATNPSSIKKNDIISYVSKQDSNILVTHRVIEIKKKDTNTIFITKGDANSSPDLDEISPGRIKGKVLFSVPYLGFISQWMKTPKGFIVLVLLPAIFIVLNEILYIVKLVEENAKRKYGKQNQVDDKHFPATKTISLFILLFGTLLITPGTAYFTSTIASSNHIFATGDWSPPPVPQLRSPTNNTIMSSSGLKQTWTYVVDGEGSNPVTYYYESCFVNPNIYAGICPAGKVKYTATFTSAQKQKINGEDIIVKNASGAPDDAFWWRVKATDTSGNTSAWSEVWKLTLDSTKPTKPQGVTILKGHDPSSWEPLGCGGVTNDTHITIKWDASTDPNIDYYWFGTKLNPKHAKVYHPTTFYKGNMTPGNNPYSYTVIAVDKAGNESAISDSCSLTLDQDVPSVPSLSIEGSYVKQVEEKVENGGFEDGLHSWTTAGDVATTSGDTVPQPTPLAVTPYEGNSMARIGNYSYAGDKGNMVWENRLMQSIPSGAKSISLHYNLASFDSIDDPAFFIRLNGNEVYAASSSALHGDNINAYSAGWQEFNYDLSDYYSGENINLALYGGNTTDESRQSWVYVDAITTYFVTAPSHAVYTIFGTDTGSGIDHYEYRIGGGDWQRATDAGTFQITEDGDRWIEYRSIDKAGNSSAVKRVRILTDAIGPGAIQNFKVDFTGTNYASLSWTAPGNDGYVGRAAKYDIRYSISPILGDDDFYSAEPASKSPVPQTAGETETAVILGLNPDTPYYFAIKAADEAPNWSPVAYADGKTLPLKGGSVSHGDIIINEIMWMGSGKSKSDEWIELRNMTDREIDLTDFVIMKYDSTSTYAPMVTLPVAKIGARGYFLIANYAPGDEQSQLKDTVIPDFVTTGMDLSDTHLQLLLTDNLGNPLDTAWDYDNDLSAGEGEGLLDETAGKYYSMERTSIPGKGDDPLNWYTCIDAASGSDFFIAGADVRGTPGAQNRSENEPYNRKSSFIPSPAPAVESTPAATLELSPDRKTVSFRVTGIEGYEALDYALSYSAYGVEKGIAGTGVDIAGKAEYEKTGLDLGTCSANVCTWDESVYNFKLSVTLTGKDGNIKQVVSEL